jgi:CheY-like chemotaxis protein
MPTVLVIEDNARQREFFRWALEHAGYRAVGARDGREGLAAYRQEAADLVLCDLFMPEMDGLATIRELLAADPGARIVATSGSGDHAQGNYLPAATVLGAALTLAKPFRPSELLDAVRRVLA